MTAPTNRPRYRCCDSCGRNDWKVAIRHPRPKNTVTSGAPVTVEGICPSCFADHINAPEGTYGSRVVASWIAQGSQVTIDLRGTRSRNQAPVPAEMLPAAPRSTTASPTGRFLWSACGHPAELDINDRCYTCHGAV